MFLLGVITLTPPRPLAGWLAGFTGWLASWQEFGGGSIFHQPSPPDSSTQADPEGGLTIEGVRIAHNSMPNVLGTQAEISLTKTEAKIWLYDFCPLLVFPQIATVKFHVMAASGFPQAVARPPEGCKVVIETSEPMTGTIVVEVDSSAPSTSFE